MKEFGLHDIDVRMSDRVLFIDPDNDNYESLISDFASVQGWDHRLEEKDIEASAEFFMNRGLTRNEAQNYVKKNTDISNYLMDHPDQAALLKFLGLVISYGRK